MQTSVYIDSKKCGTFISHETTRKDFVLWAGFTLVGVYKTLDEAKNVVKEMHALECPNLSLEFKTN